MTPIEDDLTMRARGLPRSIEPERDLWPAIEAELQNPVAETQVTNPPDRWRLGAMAAGLVMAAVLGFWAGDAMDEPTGNVGDIARTPQSAPAMAMPVLVDLQQTRMALAEAVYERIVTLPPGTRAVVTENLNTINRALDEIDRSLATTPEAGLDRQLLMSMYVDQLSLLTAMNTLVRGPNQETTL